MAKPSIDLLRALLNTAKRIETATDYQWGHMGSCNCGFLAQEITDLQKSEIHSRAMQGYGDWNEQLNDYCPTTGLPMDEVITKMLAFGFDSDDLKHLETLSSTDILRSISPTERNLRHNIKSDVVKYLRAWSALIEAQLLEKMNLPDFNELMIPAEAETEYNL